MVGAWLRSSQGESLRPEGGRLWKLCTTQVTYRQKKRGVLRPETNKSDYYSHLSDKETEA